MQKQNEVTDNLSVLTIMQKVRLDSHIYFADWIPLKQ